MKVRRCLAAKMSYPFEINGNNTTCEAFVFGMMPASGMVSCICRTFHVQKWSPFNGVGFTTHPRGGSLENFDSQFPGKRTAGFVDGTVNADTGRDRSWMVEPAFPWPGMTGWSA